MISECKNVRIFKAGLGYIVNEEQTACTAGDPISKTVRKSDWKTINGISFYNFL